LNKNNKTYIFVTKLKTFKMKRTIILLALVLAFSGAFAQRGKVTTAQTLKDAGKLDEALAAIEEAADQSNPKAEKSFAWPKTWEVRGEVFQAIGQSKDEKFKKLSADPLTEALNSYKKALELDAKGTNAKSIKIKLTLLTNDLTNQAVESFRVENYNKALLSFEQVLEIQEIPTVKMDNPTAVDTVIIFNSGLAAYNAEKYDVAIRYYRESAKYGYNGPRTFSLIAASYQLMNDTVAALDALKEGYEKYPEDNALLESMIQIYMDLNKTDEAMKYLEMAIAQDPTKPRYYFAQGALYEKMNANPPITIGMSKEEVINKLGKPNTVSQTTTATNDEELLFYDNISVNINKKTGKVDYINKISSGSSGSGSGSSGSYEQKAIDTYKKTIEIDPEFFNAYYNLGALYYNKGVQQIEVAKDVPANENAKYEAEMKKADEWFAMALPYMEKCNSLQADDKMVLESLKNLYYRLKQMDKYNAVLEQIEKNK
jgi:tetratricopeptide (TPR) repeat protein